jgi:hypothetical protein
MARCQACRGLGYRWLPPRQFWVSAITLPQAWEPCPECDGSGLEHCCEGLREQPHHPGRIVDTRPDHASGPHDPLQEQPEQAQTAASAPPPQENNDTY